MSITYRILCRYNNILLWYLCEQNRTEMLQTEHSKTFNKTKWLYPRAELAINFLNTSYNIMVINSTTTMSPTLPTMPPSMRTVLPNMTTTNMPPTATPPTTTLMPSDANYTTTTTMIPTTAYTTTRMPITTTTQRPKPNKFTCTLCVIIIVNE